MHTYPPTRYPKLKQSDWNKKESCVTATLLFCPAPTAL